MCYRRFVFVDLPDTCPTYYGPHTVECLNTVWGLAGCLPEGEKYPAKLSQFELPFLVALAYRSKYFYILGVHNNYKKTVCFCYL